MAFNNQNQVAATMSIPFLALPGEIRNVIYDLAADWNDTGRCIDRIHRQVQRKLNHRTPKGPTIYDKEIWDAIATEARPKSTPTIFLLNRQIYHEARVRLLRKPLCIPPLLPKCRVLSWRAKHGKGEEDVQGRTFDLQSLISIETLRTVPELVIKAPAFVGECPSLWSRDTWPQRSWQWPFAPFSKINSWTAKEWQTKSVTLAFPRDYNLNALQSDIREAEQTLLLNSTLTISLNLPETTGWTLPPRNQTPFAARSHAHLALPPYARKRTPMLPARPPSPTYSLARIAWSSLLFHTLPIFLVGALTALLPATTISGIPTTAIQSFLLALTTRISIRCCLHDFLTFSSTTLAPIPRHAVARATLPLTAYPSLYLLHLARMFTVTPLLNRLVWLAYVFGGACTAPETWQEALVFVCGGWTFWICAATALGVQCLHETVPDMGGMPGRRLWVGF